jgi:hypothetical protein
LREQFFISLLNPGMGLILAIAFYFLWLHRRSATYALLAAAGYASSALGFLIQDVLPGLPMQLHRIPSNLAFMLTGLLVCAAILSRFPIASWRRWWPPAWPANAGSCSSGRTCRRASSSSAPAPARC